MDKIDMRKNPCSICEIYMEGYECEIEDNKCPIAQLKSENLSLRSENLSLKQQIKRLEDKIDKLETDAGWDWENRVQEDNWKVHEMGEF
ncbi:MAG: hypothetical protein II659_04615 [Bacteroidales bacterium]|nr:hypothetical protein [Bacteroidales bacterium]